MLVRDAKGRFTKGGTAVATKRRKPKAPKQEVFKSLRQLNICFVLDKSGSMAPHVKSLIECVNTLTKQYAEEAAKDKTLITRYSILEFPYLLSGTVTKEVDIDRKIELRGDYNNTSTGGCTPLWSAVAEAVATLDTVKSKNMDNTFLVVVITDGEENQSRINVRDFQQMIREKQATDKWTFTFSVPKGYKAALAQLGVHEGNIQEWDVTSQTEMRDIVQACSVRGASVYFGALARGAGSVSNYFVANVDTKAAKKLDKLQAVKAKVWKVEAEAPVKDFVVSKAGSYVKGKAFYQLTKPETVQSYKEILVMKKDLPGADKAVYGGNQAIRNVLGLPAGDTKVFPGNLGDYDLFVQSTSVNRKLVRGTRVVYLDPT